MARVIPPPPPPQVCSGLVKKEVRATINNFDQLNKLTNNLLLL